MAICQKPRTSQPHPDHKRYPSLLRDVAIKRPDLVWCADITYVRMRRGFLYLVAIMDWHSRAVLSWRLSNTLDADFCVAALEEAMNRSGVPEIFNTDQGSQFPSLEFALVLKDAGVAVSMDGKRSVDGERLYRAAVAFGERGVPFPAGIRNWQPGSPNARERVPLRQRAATAYGF